MDRLVTLSKIVDVLGPIKGEKSLQKLIYLTEQYGDRLGYQFSWNNYGPISFKLQRDIQELSTLGLISITQENSIPIYSGTTQQSHLSSFWRHQLQSCDIPGNSQRIIQFIQSMGDKSKDPLFLEILASLDFIQRNNLDQSSVSMQEGCSEDILTSAEKSLQQLQVSA